MNHIALSLYLNKLVDDSTLPREQMIASLNTAYRQVRDKLETREALVIASALLDLNDNKDDRVL